MIKLAAGRAVGLYALAESLLRTVVDLRAVVDIEDMDSAAVLISRVYGPDRCRGGRRNRSGEPRTRSPDGVASLGLGSWDASWDVWATAPGPQPVIGVPGAWPGPAHSPEAAVSDGLALGCACLFR